jgi:tetratricopeptide (TPR) repeat protein
MTPGVTGASGGRAGVLAGAVLSFGSFAAVAIFLIGLGAIPIALGSYYDERNQSAKAQEMYTRAVRLEPSNADAHLLLAAKLLQAGERDGCKEHLDAAERYGADPEALEELKAGFAEMFDTDA